MPVSLTDPVALSDAVNLIGSRTVVGTAMDSIDLDGLEAGIKRRAFFSARQENLRLLQRMRDLITEAVSAQRRTLEDGGEGVFLDRGKFVELMREFIQAEGLARDPSDPEAGAITDIGSYPRLKLIYDTQVAMAQGFAAHQADQSPDSLDEFPANELLRFSQKVRERDWPRRWHAAGGKFFGGPGSNSDYPAAPGRMIALKTDPVWAGISRFGEPWPPFDFNSGMGVIGVDRDEAEEFELLAVDEILRPNAAALRPDFEGAGRGLDDDFKALLEQTFSGEVAA